MQFRSLIVLCSEHAGEVKTFWRNYPIKPIQLDKPPFNKGLFNLCEFSGCQQKPIEGAFLELELAGWRLSQSRIKGAKTKTERKAQASRLNGMKGGRPKAAK